MRKDCSLLTAQRSQAEAVKIPADQVLRIFFLQGLSALPPKIFVSTLFIGLKDILTRPSCSLHARTLRSA